MDQPQSTTPDTVSTLMTVESLIKNYQSRLEILTKEYRELKTMLDDLLENDDEYNQTNEAAKKAAKLKTIAKQKVLRTPAAAALVDKVKDHQSQLRELKISLSDYLSQYVTLSGSNQIDGPDGSPLEIVHSAKLVKNNGSKSNQNFSGR